MQHLAHKGLSRALGAFLAEVRQIFKIILTFLCPLDVLGRVHGHAVNFEIVPLQIGVRDHDGCACVLLLLRLLVHYKWRMGVGTCQ